MGILLGELQALYSAFSRGAPSPLPDPPARHADVTVSDRSRADRPAASDAWRPAAVHASTLPAGLAESVRSLARGSRATPAMVLLAALKLHLAASGSAADVAVRTDGRRRVELEAMVGPLADALPVRTQLAGVLSFREVLARVRDGLLDALSRDRADDGPRPGVAFTYRGGSQTSAEVLGRRLLRAAADGGRAEYGLSLEVAEAADGSLSCTWEYAMDAFDAEAVEGIADGCRELLERAAADPEPSGGARPSCRGTWTPPTRADRRSVDELLAELEDAPDDDLLPA
jgi:non-ribosomal peptide synthetase component F